MSASGPYPVLLWSPDCVAVFDPATERTQTHLTLEEAARAIGKGRQVVVALGRRVAFLKAVRLPDIPVEDLRKIVSIRLGEFFPTDGKEWAFDVQPSSDVSSEGRLTLVAAIPSTELKVALDAIRATGLKIVRSQPAALSSVASTGGDSGIVVSQTVEGWAYDVVDHGIVNRSRVVPNGSSMDQELARTKAMAGADLRVFAAASLGIPGSTPVLCPDLQSLARADLSLSLRPVEEVLASAKQHRERYRRQAVLLALAAAALAVFVYFEYDDAYAETQKQRAAMNASVNKLKVVRDSVEGKVNKLAATNSSIQLAFAPAQTPYDGLAVVSSLAPDGVWLTGITYERGKAMQVRGTARKSESVGQYLNALSAQKRFRDVKLLFANNAEIEGTDVVQFSLTAFPVGNLPILETKAKKSR